MDRILLATGSTSTTFPSCQPTRPGADTPASAPKAAKKARARRKTAPKAKAWARMATTDQTIETLEDVLGMMDDIALKLRSLHNFGHVPEPITESEYGRLKKRRREPRPARAARYEVMPDSKASAVVKMLEDREWAMKVLRDAPWGVPESESLKTNSAFGDKIRAALIDRLRKGYIECYSDMLAIEVLFADATERFGGEDPAIPELRDILDWMRL